MENEMIKNFTTEQLTKMIYSKLEPLEYEITLSKPTMENAFPIIVILTPLESITKRYNSQILEKKFQTTIQCWAKEKYDVMKIMEEVSQILTKSNFLRTSTNLDKFDEVTQNYNMEMTFELKYNGLTNSFI